MYIHFEMSVNIFLFWSVSSIFLSFYEMNPDCYFDIYSEVIINTY